MDLPSGCDFEPVTAAEAFLQQEMRKLQVMPDWLVDLVDSGDLEVILGLINDDLRMNFYRLRQERHEQRRDRKAPGVFVAMSIDGDPVTPLTRNSCQSHQSNTP